MKDWETSKTKGFAFIAGEGTEDTKAAVKDMSRKVNII